jgi:hypothetical protein
MTFPTNENSANRELSIDELEAIAAGGFWGWVKHEVDTALVDLGIVVKFAEKLLGGGKTPPGAPHKMS